MFGIYYKDPTSGLYYPCSSGAWRQFHLPHHLPSLFASEENAFKVIKGWAKGAKTSVNYDAIHVFNDKGREVKTVTPIPYEDVVIVPMTVTPDFKEETKASKP